MDLGVEPGQDLPLLTSQAQSVLPETPQRIGPSPTW